MIVQIGAGQGLSECQLAVVKLYGALKEEYGDLEEISRTRGYEKGCYDSVRFRTGQDLSGLEGTVLWICRSPFRKNHKRKNWHVDVSIIPEQTGIASEKEYRIEKFHCGGKGGQNVNKVETGVRITHIPTGLYRSVPRNRASSRTSRRLWKSCRKNSRVYRKNRRRNRKVSHGGSIPVLSGEIRCGFMRGKSLF